MRGFFAVLAVLGLAGCVAEEAPTMDNNDQCGASSLQGLVGQPESVLAAMTLPRPVRVVHPGQPVTMDYNPARLNILIDAKGRIEQIYCG